MNKFRKFSAALTLAGFVATGMFASGARLHASDFRDGGSTTAICQFLASAYSVVSSFPDSYYKKLVLKAISDKQASLGCAV